MIDLFFDLHTVSKNKAKASIESKQRSALSSLIGRALVVLISSFKVKVALNDSFAAYYHLVKV